MTTVASPGEPAAGASYSQSAVVNLPLTLSGAYTLFVVTDPSATVPEASLSNNASTPQSLTITRLIADLQVTSVSIPTAPTAGDAVTVQWSVDNASTGTTDATYWYDSVYVSTTPTLSSNSVLLGQVRHVNTLGAGSSYDASGSFVLPSDLTTGPYYFLVVTDADGQVTELTHNDDTISSGIVQVAGAPAITGPTVPDLAVSDLVVPSEAVSGRSFTVSYTVSNLGTATTTGWYDAVYLSRNQVFDPATDTYLGYVTEGSLAAGASRTIAQGFTVPDSESGPFWVFVVVDAGDAISTNSNRSNNVSTPVALTVDLTPVVDLSVGSITVPTTGALDTPTSITYTVTNTSGTAEPGAWYDAVYLSPNGVWSASDPLIGKVYHTGGVAADGSYTETLSAPLPAVAPGNYYVVVRTDVLTESAGTNATGVSTGTVAVGIPSITLGTPVTGTLTTGGTAYYQFTVAAGQTLDVSLSTNTTASINNIYLQYGTLPTLGQFVATSQAHAVADPNAVIEATQPGSYYIMVTGNSVDGTETYSLNAQTVPFSISSITPDYGSNLGSVTLTIDGAEFNADEQVEVIGADGTIRTASNVSWVNSTELWANFNLQGLAVGTYDVELGDSTQSATLPQAFQVTEVAGQIRTVG